MKDPNNKFLYTKYLKGFARANKTNQTDAEKKLWSHLRNKQLMGSKFRRQFPVSRFIIDFYCHDKKLAIELDGSQHRENKVYDQNRTRILNQYGITVIRFWDNDVLNNIENVLEEISAHLV